MPFVMGRCFSPFCAQPRNSASPVHSAVQQPCPAAMLTGYSTPSLFAPKA